jgi:methyl-accepting chemotaxis protein
MKLQNKFTLSLIAVASIIIIITTYLAYKTVEFEAKEDAYKNCYRILSSVEASRTYVRKILRPIIKKNVPKGTFIHQAMSASFVARNQFEFFLKDYPEYKVKFASTNPRNQSNQADNIELKIINDFVKNKELKEWKGITNQSNKKFYTVAKPFRLKESCMLCHSTPEKAPRAIVETYGNKKGFFRKIGDVTMYSISVPIEITTSKILSHTAFLVIPIAFLIFFTLLISSQLYKQMVTKPGEDFFEGISKLAKEDYRVKVDEEKAGELKSLSIAFNSMTSRLLENDSIRKKAEEGLQQAHEQLEQKVEERTSELLIANNDLKNEIYQREEAESEVKVLNGLLPICSHCKKIRDDKGYWTKIEEYIEEKSEAEFSHSICRDCAKEHYPDINVYED